MHKANQGPFAKERVRIPEDQRARQNLPIDSHVKSSYIYQVMPVNETCWAYMKLLREHADMKMTFPVDPYAEVYRFRENLYAIFTETLDGVGDSWMFLIDGPEKAMLIDTSFGLGDLKGLCRELVGDKELIVVNTHGHYDHAYGNCQFDRVYCHEYETTSLEAQDEHIWDYLFQDDGEPIWTQFDRKDLAPFRKYEVIGVPDGYTWDLGGGYEIELIHMGGHTAGHAGFLDKAGRNFFCGDDFISMRVTVGGSRPYLPHAECATVSFFRNAVSTLSRRKNEFDHLFPGHFVVDIENAVVDSTLEALDLILEDPEGNSDFSKKRPDGSFMYYKHIEGMGLFAYTEASVRKEKIEDGK